NCPYLAPAEDGSGHQVDHLICQGLLQRYLLWSGDAGNSARRKKVKLYCGPTCSGDRPSRTGRSDPAQQRALPIPPARRPPDTHLSFGVVSLCYDDLPHPLPYHFEKEPRHMAGKPTVLITGIAGNLGLRLLENLNDFQVIGADIREPANANAMFRFEKIDLGEERSCDQLLDLMRAYRPEAIVHLAFILDPLRSGVLSPRQMWMVNVAGTSRVIEAIAEHNRMVGGIDKFIFPSSAMVYGPELDKAVTEDAPLNAQSLP